MKNIIILLLLSYIVFRPSKEIIINKEFITYKVTLQKDTIPLNQESVHKFIEGINLKFPEVVLAQTLLESGNFQAKNVSTNNNLFGMKHPRQRPTLSLGIKNGYANFESWRHSIADYAIWQSKFGRKCKTQEEYLNLLANIYASDSNYKKKLLNLIRKINATASGNSE